MKTPGADLINPPEIGFARATPASRLESGSVSRDDGDRLDIDRLTADRRLISVRPGTSFSVEDAARTPDCAGSRAQELTSSRRRMKTRPRPMTSRFHKTLAEGPRSKLDAVHRSVFHGADLSTLSTRWACQARRRCASAFNGVNGAALASGVSMPRSRCVSSDRLSAEERRRQVRARRSG